MPSIGKDIAHDSAVTHVSGESIFLDDLPAGPGELLAGIVPSPVAHGTIKRLDLSATRATPGVVAVLTAADVPGHNLFGASIKDELLLVEDEAVFLGQPLAIIAAENAQALHRARKAAIVEMNELPPIFSIDDAIAAKQFFGSPRWMARGDVEAGFADADGIIEGVLEIGGQEHFYLESQIAIAIPGEQGQMTIHSSTQHPSEVQMMTAEVLGVPFNHVVCICKRMGGGFGGKETQAAQPAMMAALLAARTRRPVRFVYSKDEDMRYTGKRHPFKAFYKAGYTSDGRITSYDLRLYSNGGCSTDLSFAVLERAMLHADNAYFLPNVRIEGRICRTNLPSNTAFRGFGGPQGIAAIENLIEEIAARLKIDALCVREANCYGVSDRNTTPYGQVVQNNVLPKLFQTLRGECDYDARRADTTRFNSISPTHLRGM
ncbi:MAG TPA: molybdopterin cofactor-binding domain-containing protein, partial [Tepidisphaeraceae bacterium]